MKSRIGKAYRVCGIVQGVGFRPFIAQLAIARNVTGWVGNDGQGVFIEVCAEASVLDDFFDAILADLPALAVVDSIEEIAPVDVPALLSSTTFSVHRSQHDHMITDVPADAVTCDACLAEVLDEQNRRSNYAFTNCTHCGPRFSIIQAMPYDRAQTTMKDFVLCSLCAEEYQAVDNRRFHAQPNACAVCGPQLSLYSQKNAQWHLNTSQDDMLLEIVVESLKRGEIVAIKGVGGFHLVCDAHNPEAVKRLRQKKRRPDKPLAIMVKDIDSAKQISLVSDFAQELLQNSAGPIVLLPKKPEIVLQGIAPRQNYIGVMLPMSPLHHLLMRLFNNALVFTSANRSGEPQLYEDEQALEVLRPLAEHCLTHNRPIIRRLEDSVVRCWPTMLNRVKPRSMLLRQGRGYAPLRLALPTGFENSCEMVAAGADLKSSIAIVKGARVVLSHTLGDQGNYASQQAYHQAWQDMLDFYQLSPSGVAYDKHPAYFTSNLARQLPLKHYPVQHHHAHFCAVMAEYQLPEKTNDCLGWVLDGLGYGDDGALWGGECFLGGYQEVKRVATLKPIPLLGGEKAQKEPWRVLFAHVYDAFGESVLDHQSIEFIQQLKQKPTPLLIEALKTGVNVPMSHSAGRLFDAVAAALGICFEEMSYEGQAAMELEALLDEAIIQRQLNKGYDFVVEKSSVPWQINPRPMWAALIEDLEKNEQPAVISARFHIGLAKILAKMTEQLSGEFIVNHVTLSGGVAQNLWLASLLDYFLAQKHLNLYVPQIMPSNDGGVAVGQIFAALAQRQRH